MINKRIVKIEGTVDASKYHREAFIIELTENHGVYDENSVDLIKLLHELDRKKISITMEVEE